MDTRSGFQIATVAGIPIRIHVTFILVLPLLALGFGRSFSAAARLAEVPPEALGGPPVLWGLAVAVALFASVLLHELAHSLYAVRRGVRVRGITLLMIGGVSEMADRPRDARTEALMALVGPLTSLALGALAFGLFLAVRSLPWFNARFAVFYLAQLNVFLGLFNLLPAFPMDGGRILRGVLTPRLGLARATQIAAAVGKVFAVLFAIAGLMSANFLLLIIAFFVYVGAEGEPRDVLARGILGDLLVRDVMTPRTVSVSSEDSVEAVGDRMVRERRLAFPVTDGEQVSGLVTLDGIQKVAPERRLATPVREAMGPAQCVSPNDTVGDALRALGPDPASAICVVDDGHLVGMLSQTDVYRALKLRELDESQRRAHGSSFGREAPTRA